MGGQKSLAVSLNLNEQRLGSDIDVTIALVVKEGSAPFHSTTLCYPGMSPEATDLLEGIIQQAAGTLPLAVTMTETEFVALEGKLIGALQGLNGMAQGLIGKTKEEKRKLAKQMLAGGGKRSA